MRYSEGSHGIADYAAGALGRPLFITVRRNNSTHLHQPWRTISKQTVSTHLQSQTSLFELSGYFARCVIVRIHEGKSDRRSERLVARALPSDSRRRGRVLETYLRLGCLCLRFSFKGATTASLIRIAAGNSRVIAAMQPLLSRKSLAMVWRFTSATARVIRSRRCEQF